MALRLEEYDAGAVDLDRDRALVLRYQRGDDAAFDELYRRYYPRLHLYCQRRVGDPHTSEELAQEAFLRALRAMPRFAGERRFYPWMTVIAQRLCIDHHRRAAHVETSAEVDLGTIEPDHDALYAAVDRDHLRAAIGHLAPRHREILELREQRGWSYQQIASEMDVPVTTVEALLHRARKALKREFLAVSAGTRLASLPFVGWVIARAARIRARVSGAEHLVPAAGTAAAGLAAIGLVLTPFGATPAPALTAPQPAAVAHSAQPSAAGNGGLIIDLPTSAASTPSSERPRTTPSASTPPPPIADTGVATVYAGDDGASYIKEQNDQQPVHIEVPHLIDAGVNPVQIVGDVAQQLSGGNP